MAKNIAQRRAAKALKRKAVVRAKRKAEAAAQGRIADEDDWAPAALVRTHKASEALIDVAEPLISDDDDRDTRHKCLLTTMFAWNVSLLPETEQTEQMHRFFDELAGIGKDTEVSDVGSFSEFEEVIAELIARKRWLYPFDRRWLLGLELFESSDSYHVVVQSAIGPAV
jgi:hypothetical protein